MDLTLYAVPLLIFIFGLIVGSFLNVVIYRWNTGRSAAKGRSCCFSCGKPLHWYELVPVVSYLVQGGKCRSCTSVLSYQYITVELLTGFLFTAVALRFDVSSLVFNPLDLIFWWAVVSILIVITVYDIRHTIIPDSLALLIACAGLFALYVRGGGIADLSVGVVAALLFAGIWFFSKGRAMGLGDAKLVLGIGWLLPWDQAISAIVAAFWFGAVVGLGMIFLQRRKVTLKSEIPFAPFLALGLVSMFLTKVSFLALPL